MTQPELYCLELLTPQWAIAVDWYRRVLGLRVLVRVVDDQYALLAVGGTRLAIVGRQNAPRAGSRSNLVFEVADINAALARLHAAGETEAAVRQHSERFSEITLADPDGHCVRLIAWPAKPG